MDLTKKVNIIIFSIMFILYIGAAIVASAYIWLLALIILTVGIFYLQDKLNDSIKNTRFTRFFPIVIVLFFIIATETSRDHIAENPQSITVYTDEVTNQERVLVKYGIYNALTFAKEDSPRSRVDLNVTSSGYELAEPLYPSLEVYAAIYIFLGIPLVLNAVVSILNQTRSISKNITSRESVFKVIMSSSGDRFHSHNPKTAHVQYHHSFIQEDAKKDMVNEHFDERAKQNETKKDKDDKKK
ncbi:MAG: hypothetical protein ACLFPM_04705 [Candidatus Izemoplasmatales bacterium]